MAKETVDPCEILSDFLERCRKVPDKPIYVGIDPGAEGAISFVCGQSIYAVVDIPVIRTVVTRQRSKKRTLQGIKRIKDPEKRAAALQKFNNGEVSKTVKGETTKFDLSGISRLFRVLRQVKPRVTVVLEQAPPSLGPGKRLAEILLNRAYAMWPLFLNYNGYRVEEIAPSVWKKKMGLWGKDKPDSRLKAQKLFPKADIGLVKHHNRAEALLVVACLQQMHAGGTS